MEVQGRRLPPRKVQLGGTRPRPDVVAVWPEATDAQLPRKSPHSVEPCGARTANRLRWARRKSSGARESSGQGTRQLATVTSEEGGPRRVKGLAPGAFRGRRETAVATVYQKDRTLRTRKRKYRV